MLSSLRKFSNSIYAKIFLVIVAAPFIFWGMGSSFSGGNKNVVVTIDNEKFSTQDFADYIQQFSPPDQKIESSKVDELFSIYIGDKLMQKEVEDFGIVLSDISLSKLIKNQKEFKRSNIFSRPEYEKFLIANNLSAVTFEANLASQEKKRQLLELIGGGIKPSKFLINSTYNKINQKRDIQLINLNEVFKKEFNFSPDKIKSYYNDNMEKYEETYKSIEFLELSPKKLTDNNEFNEIFYEKINEIDNLIIQGENLEFIIENFNLGLSKSYTLDKLGRDLNSKKVENLPEKIEEKIFNLSNTETTALMEFQNKYFLVEIIKTENIQKNFENEILKKSILAELQNELVRKEMSKIISKINQNNFKKIDFEKISNEKKVAIQKISLKNSNDNKILKSDMVKQIYDFPEKMVIVVNSFDLSENFLIYIDKVINVTIEEDSKDYTKYFNLSKIELANILFDTYDDYIKQKYEIEINYKALDTVKRYFN